MRSGATAALLLVTLLLAGALGCGGDDDPSAPPTDEPPSCEAPELALPDGTCIRPGVQPDGCAEGFVHDGEYGCEPSLPTEPCPDGLMAVPGDTACRSVMPCGEGRWGDIPSDGATVHVDGAYTGGGDDGTAERPFTTIGAAVAAAPPGSLIAVAEGSYHEDVVIEGKPLRLRGRCPERVEIVGAGAESAALVIATEADGTEVGGVAIRGTADGVLVAGSLDVLLEQLWVHDNAEQGIKLSSALGATSARLAHSLIERNHDIGVFFVGSDGTVEGSVVRTTMPRLSDDDFGIGITVQVPCSNGVCDTTMPSTVAVRGSLVEQNHEFGLLVLGSDLTVEATVVRDTLPRAQDQAMGRGINAQLVCSEGSCDGAARATLAVRGSLVERNHDLGMFVWSSDVDLEDSVIRATLPEASTQGFGRGLHVQHACPDGLCEPAARPSATIRRSLVQQNYDVGLLVVGSDAIVDGTVVRGTLPRASDLMHGGGIAAQAACPNGVCDPEAGSVATIRGSFVDQSCDTGMFVAGSDVVIERTVVRATAPQASDQQHGRGINVQPSCVPTGCDPAARSTASIVGSVVEHSYDVGLVVVDSDAIVDGAVIRATLPQASDSLFGDGVAVVSVGSAASAVLSSLLIDDSARAGIANFGASVSLSQTTVRCAAVALNGEPVGAQGFAFDDEGDNRCGCPDVGAVCQVVSAALEPPAPLTQ